MYKHFFGLSENPFNVNPDPRYLFLTPQTQRALDELTYGIHTRKGLLLLTGEVGTGKTTMINRLLDQLREPQTPTAFIFNSHLEISQLFDFILADFGLPLDSGLSSNALMRLNQWLLERYCTGETPVLIVDEAQGLPNHVLEEIRMLLNLETPREKLLQIVLVGQPELEERIKRPELRQLKQRVALRCKTVTLTLKETHDYIQTRLDIAGANGKPAFAPQTMDAVYLYSHGVPRVINLLCENALINAYVDHVKPVPVHIVAEVAHKFQFDDVKPVASLRDSGDALDFNFIAPQSSSFVSAPATPEPPCEEDTGAITNAVLPQTVVADDVLSPVKEPATPVLDCEKIPELKPEAESSRPLDVQVTIPFASQPAQTETSRPSELSEFFSDVSIQFFPGSATKPAPLALPPLPRVVETKGQFDSLPTSRPDQTYSPRKPAQPPTKVDATKSDLLRSAVMKISAVGLILARSSTRWKDRLLCAAVSLARVLDTAIVLQQLKRSLQPVRALFRPCLIWRDRCLHFVRSLDWPPMTASVHRWFRQPWNPTPRRPHSRLIESLRRFSHKKA